MQDQQIPQGNTQIEAEPIIAEEYLSVSDKEIRNKKRKEERQKKVKDGLNRSKSKIFKEMSKINKRADVSLLELSDLFFDTLIENIDDPEIQREVAFTKNKMSYIISNITI